MALLGGITSKHHSDSHCLNCLHVFAIENKHESHKKVRENKDFSNVLMPSENSEILEFNQYQISDEVPYIIYSDLEFLIENIKNKVSIFHQVFQCLQYRHLKA